MKRQEREPELSDDWDVHACSVDPEEIYRAVEELYRAKRCMMAAPAEAYIYVERAIEALEHA